ncbi:DegT/DnrJ/EryC1/StrS family aminotransferase [Rhodobium gokarnense]|uniref:dTDP-4-amino-4,6-dideoxygalactose transaminase n=1 Tax=Rhodobium gokarnense TaxID=364296 RepID=A0ABT3HI19_9HYPH|nr:DegT/DnrJ/EryC1/StrS family aminotransferase [Rhodobium gokarnense]MCW2309949.1 dTDP-4-amino-4,6-dideoxygalactose transaminase [Rhodobium gokarnense]
MDWKYTLSEPVLGDAEKAAVLSCLESGWLSMGPNTQAFEKRFSELTGAKHAIAVANGTAALHLAMAALEIGSGETDEVIQPSINFVAAANMTNAVGAKPVFADIVALDEPTIAPAEIERRITPNTKAVVVMHFGGYPARMAEILDICEAHGLPLIEDACHAPLYRMDDFAGRALGTLGAVGCFSFFSNKNMTTGEGGMVTTDDDALAAKIRNLRSHGMTSLSWDRHHGRPATYDVTAHGYNYRIDDLRSALGRAQLERLDDLNALRQGHARAYADLVARASGAGMRYIYGSDPEGGTAHLAGILVPREARNPIRQMLADNGIQSSLHYPPVHLFTAFADTASDALPLSEEFAETMITLPMHAYLPDAAPGDIIGLIAEKLTRNAA